MIGASLAATLAQVAAVPPPPLQLTADCVHPTYATDMLVCGDPSLRSLDDRLKAAVAKAPTLEATPLVEDQADWFRRSRRCAFRVDHRTCAIGAYNERLTVVALERPPATASGQCRLADGTSAQIATSDGIAVLIRFSVVVAVGMAETPAWRPFVRYTRRNDRATLRDLDGKPLAMCRFDTTARSHGSPPR